MKSMNNTWTTNFPVNISRWILNIACLPANANWSSRSPAFAGCAERDWFERHGHRDVADRNAGAEGSLRRFFWLATRGAHA
ncbi:MAG: hypothetical protein PHY45_15660 [Rhodocyclaceae bacterium]|nr:hypothetical protein [Rhodocyclaceae bacterium]